MPVASPVFLAAPDVNVYNINIAARGEGAPAAGET